MAQAPCPDAQAALLDWLMTPAAYGAPADQAVQRIDTHAAAIFLIGARAFKLKRAVAYSFLDFRTLEARHAALAAELRLNRRTAPELYRRVLPITAAPQGGFALAGDGEVQDWLLEMARFDQAALLDRLAVEGRIDAALIERLAAAIAEFHARAEPHPEQNGKAGMAAVVQGNAADLAGLAAGLGRAEQIASITARTDALLAAKGPLLEARGRAGMVRRCHGDLHLGNIVLLGERPVLFDCLEFDEALATIDLLYDLAFLLMDLCHRGLDALACRLLDRYLELTGDDAGTALLPLFLAVRATIRAKIEGFEAELGTDEAAEHRAAASRYLDLAASLLWPAPPRLIAVGGISGTGKSSLAQALAPSCGAAPGAVVLRSDVARKQHFGVAPTERLPPAAYDAAVSAEIYDQLRQRAQSLLEAGRSVIVDAVHLAPAERAALERVAHAAGVPFQGFWLAAPGPVLAARVAGRQGDASDATLAVLARQQAIDPGPLTWQRLDASGPTPGLLAQARRALDLAP